VTPEQLLEQLDLAQSGPLVVDVGDNVVQVLLALIAFGGLVLNYLSSRGAKHAAERAEQAGNEAARQLQNNGGGSALDKLEAGQLEVLRELEHVGTRMDDHARRLARIEQQQLAPPAD
jgi:flagellar biosynthesis/type III secretory pathway M-ring protein FliF/YscJ